MLCIMCICKCTWLGWGLYMYLHTERDYFPIICLWPSLGVNTKRKPVSKSCHTFIWQITQKFIVRQCLDRRGERRKGRSQISRLQRGACRPAVGSGNSPSDVWCNIGWQIASLSPGRPSRDLTASECWVWCQIAVYWWMIRIAEDGLHALRPWGALARRMGRFVMQREAHSGINY